MEDLFPFIGTTFDLCTACTSESWVLHQICPMEKIDQRSIMESLKGFSLYAIYIYEANILAKCFIS